MRATSSLLRSFRATTTIRPTSTRAFHNTPISAMKAYWYDNQPGDQRLPHDSGREVSPSYLSNLGIMHYNYPTSDLSPVNELAKSRDYKNRDEITISPTTLPNYEDKVKMFFNEHLHEDEEIRYILDGGGFFDVRSKDDDWVRIKLEKGDLM